MPINALDVLCAQLTRDLFAIAEFLLRFNCLGMLLPFFSFSSPLLLPLFSFYPFLSPLPFHHLIPFLPVPLKSSYRDLESAVRSTRGIRGFDRNLVHLRSRKMCLLLSHEWCSYLQITKSLGHVGQDAAIVQLHAACSGNMVLVS